MSQNDIGVVIGGDNASFKKAMREIPGEAKRELDKAEKIHQQHLSKKQQQIAAFEKKRDDRRKAYFEIDQRRAEVGRMRLRGQRDGAAFSQIQIDYDRELLSIAKKRWLTDSQRLRLRNSASATREAKVAREHTRISKREGDKRIAQAKKRADQRVAIEKNALARMRRDQQRHDFVNRQALNRRTARHSKSMRRIRRATNIAGIAGAASMGVMSVAIRAAAKDNAQLRGEIDKAGKANSRFMASLGNDLASSGVVGMWADMVDGASKFREVVSDSLTDLFAMSPGHAARIRAAQQDAINRQKAFDKQRAIIGIQQRMTVAAGGTEGFDVGQQLERNEFMKSLADAGLNAMDRAPLVDQFEQNQQKEKIKRFEQEEQERLRKLNEERLKALAIERELLEIRLQHNPKDYNAARQIDRIRFQEDELGGTDPMLAAKRSAQRQREIDWKESQDKLEQKRIDKTIERQLRDDKIDRIRLSGQDKLANRLEIIERYEQSISDIKARQNITDEQRLALLENAELNRDAQLGSIGRNTQGSTRTITAGLGGSAQVYKQVFGAGSSTSTAPENTTATNTTRALPLLAQIVENTANLSQPVLGA